MKSVLVLLIMWTVAGCTPAGSSGAGPERDGGNGGRPRADGGADDATRQSDAVDAAAGEDARAADDGGDGQSSDGPDDVADSADDLGEDALDDIVAADTATGSDVATVDDGSGDLCVAVEGTAESTVLPVDVIWVVDNSLSMQEEVELISDNINTFSTFIGSSGIDYRVVMLSYDDPVVGDGWYHVCVPPPLSATAPGVCPTGRDVDSARYLHVRQIVDSVKPLTELLENWSAYRDFIRPDAVQHIILVTDDNAEQSAADFRTAWSALSPGLADTVVHSIVTTARSEIRDPFDDSCTTPGCPCGYRVGDVHMELSRLTGGEVFSICDADWGSIFDAIAASVVEGTVLPCSYDVPPPEDDESTVDADRVNVFFTPAGGSRTLVPGVDAPGECGAAPGWYWPTAGDVSRIELCPASCGLIDGNVELEFGCRTIKD